MDIRFYDFNLNLVKILPQSSSGRGYSSINTTREFNGTGSLEIVFYDEELQKTVEEYDDNLIVSWNGFQGFLTGHIWKENEFRLLGMHLNGIIHRIVTPLYSPSSLLTVEYAISYLMGRSGATWLTYVRNSNFTNKYTIALDNYENADAAVSEILKLDGAGYLVYADFKEKKIYFTCLNSVENPLVISVANKNAYDVQISKSNKEHYNAGYFCNESDTWQHIGNGNDSIFTVNCVLESSAKGKAENELLKKTKMYDITAMTKGIREGVDYNVGDIVRFQVGGVTVKKKVSAISKHLETEYGEEPTFTEV